MRQKSKRPDNIKDILHKVVYKIQEEPKDKEKILDAWGNVVGPKAKEHSKPASITRDTLTIEVDSSPWMYELNLNKNNILKNLAKLLNNNSIRDIRFKIGEMR